MNPVDLEICRNTGTCWLFSNYISWTPVSQPNVVSVLVFPDKQNSDRNCIFVGVENARCNIFILWDKYESTRCSITQGWIIKGKYSYHPVGHFGLIASEGIPPLSWRHPKRPSDSFACRSHLGRWVRFTFLKNGHVLRVIHARARTGSLSSLSCKRKRGPGNL